MQTTEIIRNASDERLRHARNEAERHAADPSLSDDARRVADELADQLNAEIVARRQRSAVAARLRAYETLEPGDVIFVENVRAGGSGLFWPAHYAQVVGRPDGSLGVRGLLGGGAASGPLPTDSTRWWLVGSAGPATSGTGARYSWSDPAESVARAHRESQPRPSFISFAVTRWHGERSDESDPCGGCGYRYSCRCESWYDGETSGLLVRRHA